MRAVCGANQMFFFIRKKLTFVPIQFHRLEEALKSICPLCWLKEAFCHLWWICRLQEAKRPDERGQWFETLGGAERGWVKWNSTSGGKCGSSTSEWKWELDEWRKRRNDMWRKCYHPFKLKCYQHSTSNCYHAFKRYHSFKRCLPPIRGIRSKSPSINK